MPTYTVHAPPSREGDQADDPERFVFVRDGFYFWAFVLAPFWLLAHRLWLALVGYVIVTGLIGGVFRLAGATGTLEFLGSLAVALVVGFEAATLWRWTLSRRGWRMVGFVVGADAETAERHFFTEWARGAPAAVLPSRTAVALRRPPADNQVIGLFPDPRA